MGNIHNNLSNMIATSKAIMKSIAIKCTHQDGNHRKKYINSKDTAYLKINITSRVDVTEIEIFRKDKF